jgi:TonB family protein
VSEPVRLFSFDEDEDLALLKLPTVRGAALPMAGGELLSLGAATYVAKANDLAGSLRSGTLQGVFTINNRCYFGISPEGPLAIGSPVIDGHGKVIGIVVTPPERNEHYSYCAHVSRVIAQIGRTDRSPGGVPGLRSEEVIKQLDGGNCIEGILGRSNVPPPPPPPPPPKEGERWVPTEPIRKSGGVLQESALEKVRPDYPEEAKEARVAGSVVVELTIDEAGEVIKTRVVSGHALLRDAAEEAARQWKFKPTTLSGIPVKVIGNITFNFTL